MKNSQPMMKKMMMPLRISANDWLRPNTVEISLAPRSRNTSRKLVKIMPRGLNLASHETMTAVKPWPPAMVVVIVWSVPDTSSTPAMPHSAPDSSIVRTMTLPTLMPT